MVGKTCTNGKVVLFGLLSRRLSSASGRAVKTARYLLDAARSTRVNWPRLVVTKPRRSKPWIAT